MDTRLYNNAFLQITKKNVLPDSNMIYNIYLAKTYMLNMIQYFWPFVWLTIIMIRIIEILESCHHTFI